MENIDEFIYQNEELLDEFEKIDHEENEETLLEINGYRIQIPELGISIREGTLYTHYEDSDEDWEPDAAIVLLYDLEEKDPLKYLLWSTDDIQGTAYDYLYEKINNFDDLDSYKCVIDTSER
jgi:hypothetical protein